MRSLTIALAASAIALSACGGGGSAGSADSQGELMATPFIVESITVDGTAQEVYPPVAISFAPDAIGVATPCNGLNGSLTFAESTLQVGPLASTKMACEPELMEQDRVIAEALQANPTWEYADGMLTLTGGSIVIVAEAAEI